MMATITVDLRFALMADDVDYKRAYERQKQARAKAESLLEIRARELYEINESLQVAYDQLNEQKDQLVQQEKLASIGLLAAGVAHEINNPVGFVKSNLQTLEHYSKTYGAVHLAYKSLVTSIQEGDKEKTTVELNGLNKLLEESDLEYIVQDGIECINESLMGIKRIEEIVVNLSDFARSEKDERTKCNINDLLENSLKLLWNEIKYKCEVVKDYGEVPEIFAWAGELRQVFVNIVVNAAQAIEEQGTVTLRTMLRNDKIVIDIKDTGPGMADETLKRLFDPFYTTKEVGSGTGLGLYLSHGIIQKHHGTLIAENNAGGGACFSITLPVEVRGSR